MADAKITALNELTTPEDGDMLAIIDDPTGSAETKKIKKSLLSSFPTRVEAFLSGADQTIANTSFTKIALNGETLDNNTEFDSATNYRWTAKEAGTYYAYGQLWCAPGADKFMIVAVYKNDGLIAQMKTIIATTDYSGSGVSKIFTMNGTTDYIELYGYQNSGGNLAILAGAGYTYLNIFRIA